MKSRRAAFSLVELPVVSRNKSTGFTLVELLVVIGILAVLMGVLIPVLAKARTAASSTVCQSNLRQLQQASLEYSVENGGYLPPAHFDFITKDLHRWHGTRPTMNDPFDFTFSPLKPYLQQGAIKQCPSFEPDIAGGFEQSAGGYGYNNHYLGSSMEMSAGPMNYLKFESMYINSPAKMAMIHHPAETIMFADAAMAWPGLIEYSFVEPPLASGFPTSPSIHFRHAGRANVVWVDGHVTSQLMEWTYPGLNVYLADNAANHLGFFGPRDNSLFDRN
jgi:prepilin-type processing-associated H-X9-DG protein/prepilin-type N-terminal cleavage/methylation domain-containing protein